MISIKIQCSCGQHYTFDIEPVGGRMPSAVACPACGADGTDAANAIIAQSAAQQEPPVAAAASVRLHVAPAAASSHPAKPTTHTHHPGRIDPTQAMHEARAKITWGDPPDKVTAFLMGHGFNREDASLLVQELFDERNAMVRGNGVKSIVAGIALLCVPIAAAFIIWVSGYFYVKTLAITIVIGLYGVWLIIKGAHMVMAPKSQPGDSADVEPFMDQ